MLAPGECAQSSIKNRLFSSQYFLIFSVSGDTLPAIASRPEVYGNSDRKYQLRLVEANQDYYDFNPNRLFVGQQLIVPRGKAWGDEVAAE